MNKNSRLAPYALIIMVCISALPAFADVSHIVMVWLNEDVSQEQKLEILERANQLEKIPSVKQVRAGFPISSQRKVVDDSFSIGLVITLDSKESIQGYLDHPIHKDFVATHLVGKTKNMVIHDF